MNLEKDREETRDGVVHGTTGKMNIINITNDSSKAQI